MTRAPLAIALALVPALALAQPYDPSLHFSTLETPHFRIHFHQGEEPLARRVARVAEAAHELLVPLVGHEPTTRTEVILVDTDDSANGYATPIPRDTIELLAAAPDSRSELDQYEDWVWQLFTHEYTHVLHLDTIGGPSRVLNAVFGKQLSPNDAWPHWYLEGLAVWAESRTSRGGRLKSSLFDMELRAQLLEHGTLPLSTLSSMPLAWPRTQSWYLDGSHFLDFIATTSGDEALRGISHDNAATWIPYFLNTIAKREAGASFDELYARWLAQARARAEAQVKAVGTPTSEARLTFDGESRGPPRASIDGGTVYSILADADRKPRLVAFDLATGKERTIVEVNDVGGLATLPDGRLVLSQPELFHDYESFDDLFVVDPARGTFDQVTHGARLSEPDVAKDGRIVAVERLGPGRTALVMFDSLAATTRAGRVLFEGPELEPATSPRFSPDGKWLVFGLHRGTSYDLERFDLETNSATPLVTDDAEELEPSFSEDGARVLFSSDRDGIYDVYEVDLATRSISRRTRITGGAFEPFELGGRLYYLRYGVTGYDLARQDGPPIHEPPPPAHAVEGPPLPDSLARETTYPVHRYDPFQTLWPTFWLPTLGADPAGTTLGLVFGGADVLDDYSYRANAWWNVGAREPGFVASLRTDALRPSLELDASRLLDVVPGAPDDYVERTTSGRLTASYAFRREYSSTTVSLGWQLAELAPAIVPKLSPTGPPLPEQGRLATAIASVAFSDALRFSNSISREEGRRLSVDLRGSAPFLGSDFTNASLDGAWAEYVRVPFTEHHVLALRLAGGVFLGDLGGRQEFGLGGPSTVSVLSDALALQSPTTLLRGYPPNVASGRAFVLGSAEYRFPLFAPELGHSTWPVELRRVHGALFVDSGDAFSNPIEPSRLRTGVGAELRFELVLGYELTTELRVGYARGLNAGGENQLLALWGTSY